jgi:hypothetical protein
MAKPGMNRDIPQRCGGIERGLAGYPSRRKALILAGFHAGVKDVKDFPPSFPSIRVLLPLLFSQGSVEMLHILHGKVKVLILCGFLA